MRFTVRSIALALGVCSVVALGSTAGAHPITVGEDQTENVVSFEYDSASGDITSEGNKRRPADEDVTFTVAIRETEDTGSGLMGRLRLRLNGDHRTVYNGWFTLKIKDAENNVAYKRSKPANVQLYPRPGMRRASVPFRFDLPTGSYEATGSFRSE